MIAVLDYGMGNLRSVKRALEHVGATVQVTGDPSIVAKADRIVLPGVGAFGEAIKRIDLLGLRKVMLPAINRPLLGICLGMQLLFEGSEENPGVPGLSLLPGQVKRFSTRVKVPHIGWNDVMPCGGKLLGPDARSFYFDHSYCVPSSTGMTGTTTYDNEFVSAVENANIMGVQFHPEKSQDAGLELLKTFAHL